MTTKIGINGFGRIGRQVLKAIIENYPDELEAVAFNDIGELDTMAHLFKYDSTYGRFDGSVEAGDNELVVNGISIKALSERDPADLPWKELGVEVVIESTGLFRSKNDAEKHILGGGAKKVIISAPAKGEDLTVVLGVNDSLYDPNKHHVISNASCTTNGLAPAVKVIHDAYTVKRGFMTTVHAYTTTQRILDLPHKDLRRARAAGLNIIPTTTGAARALKLVIPDLEGKIDGYSLRVPIPTVSVIDLTVELGSETTTKALRQLYREAASGELNGILDAVEEPLVSVDYKGSSFSSSVDLPFTMVLGEGSSSLAKVVAWYDNEWGYSVRTADLAAKIAEQL